MYDIEIQNVSFSYGKEEILKDVSLTVDKGNVAVIIGENGSGKTTLLKLLIGELYAKNGTIALNGNVVTKNHPPTKIGYVPQMQPMEQRTFPITVLEFVVLGLYDSFGFIKIAKKKQKEQAIALLKKMELEKYIHTPFRELSGGLKQRMMIARALLSNPHIFVLDEPTVGIDAEHKEKLARFIREMRGKITFVIVTHETDWARDLKIDASYKMKEGMLHHVRI